MSKRILNLAEMLESGQLSYDFDMTVVKDLEKSKRIGKILKAYSECFKALLSNRESNLLWIKCSVLRSKLNNVIIERFMRDLTKRSKLYLTLLSSNYPLYKKRALSLVGEMTRLEEKKKELYGSIDETLESNWVSGEMYDIEKTLCKVRDNTELKELESNMNSLKVQLEALLKEEPVSLLLKKEDCKLLRLYPMVLIDCEILSDCNAWNDVVSMLVWIIPCFVVVLLRLGRFAANPGNGLLPPDPFFHHFCSSSGEGEGSNSDLSDAAYSGASFGERWSDHTYDLQKVASSLEEEGLIRDEHLKELKSVGSALVSTEIPDLDEVVNETARERIEKDGTDKVAAQVKNVLSNIDVARNAAHFLQDEVEHLDRRAKTGMLPGEGEVRALQLSQILKRSIIPAINDVIFAYKDLRQAAASLDSDSADNSMNSDADSGGGDGE